MSQQGHRRGWTRFELHLSEDLGINIESVKAAALKDQGNSTIAVRTSYGRIVSIAGIMLKRMCRTLLLNWKQ